MGSQIHSDLGVRISGRATGRLRLPCTERAKKSEPTRLMSDNVGGQEDVAWELRWAIQLMWGGSAGGRLRGLVKAEGRMGSWNNNNSAAKVWKGGSEEEERMRRKRPLYKNATCEKEDLRLGWTRQEEDEQVRMYSK